MSGTGMYIFLFNIHDLIIDIIKGTYLIGLVLFLVHYELKSCEIKKQLQTLLKMI